MCGLGTLSPEEKAEKQAHGTRAGAILDGIPESRHRYIIS